MIYNVILIFYANLCCLIRCLILIYYIIVNGDYIIMISSYFRMDKYSYYIIILRVWIIGLIYLSLLFDEKNVLRLKIIT